MGSQIFTKRKTDAGTAAAVDGDGGKVDEDVTDSDKKTLSS